MVVDIALVTAAIGAATSAVGLFDKMADQIERFITKRPDLDGASAHRFAIENSGSDLIATHEGEELQRITAQDLANLPPEQLTHITVLEKSMQNHYAIWSQVYPQLALMEGIQKAKVEQQLREIVNGMKGDLEAIFSFLMSCGFSLDDHYMRIRHVIAQA